MSMRSDGDRQAPPKREPCRWKLLTVRVYAVLACACASVQVTPAHSAMWENATCTWLFEDTSESRPDLANAIIWGDGASIKICDFFFVEDETYFVAEKIYEGPQGVCQYVIVQIFRDEKKDDTGQTWSILPPSGWQYPPVRNIFMTLPEGECPRQDDSSYIVVRNVSEGVFHAFTSFWRDARHDIRVFEEASSRMSEAELTSDAFRYFKEFLLSGVAATDEGNNPNIKVRLSSVLLINQIMPLGGVFYDAIFSEPGKSREDWIMTFDVTPDGVRIYRVAHVVE